MKRRPFRILPHLSRSSQLGWTYLRWGRRLHRVSGRRAPLEPTFYHALPVVIPVSVILWVCIWTGALHLAAVLWP